MNVYTPRIPRTCVTLVNVYAFTVMYDAGVLDDEIYQGLMQAVGFRNTMIHDYLNFDEAVLVRIVREKKYLEICDFLLEKPDYNAVQRSRIENFSW